MAKAQATKDLGTAEADILLQRLNAEAEGLGKGVPGEDWGVSPCVRDPEEEGRPGEDEGGRGAIHVSRVGGALFLRPDPDRTCPLAEGRREVGGADSGCFTHAEAEGKGQDGEPKGSCPSVAKVPGPHVSECFHTEPVPRLTRGEGLALGSGGESPPCGGHLEVQEAESDNALHG